jgi:flagella basal body P-ring formation protein FlgA
LAGPLPAADTNESHDTPAWQLLPQARVDSSGVYLDQVAVPPLHVVLPHVRLASAPIPGQTVPFTRAQITALLREQATPLEATNWTGAFRVLVSRRTRSLADGEMLQMLTECLQRDYAKDRGELELHFDRPFAAITVPDEQKLTLKVIELPSSGVMPNFVARCELWNESSGHPERIGEWQLPMIARLWREVPVARSPLMRGQSLIDADIGTERRDILALRDVYMNYPTRDATLELAESVAPGMVIINRAVRVRPLIQRGKTVDGIVQQGSMSISLRVEVLEDGAAGQMVRVRNPRSRTELFGKVQNEQTVLITL